MGCYTIPVIGILITRELQQLEKVDKFVCGFFAFDLEDNFFVCLEEAVQEEIEQDVDAKYLVISTAKNAISSMRAIIENVNSWLKIWKIC